MDRATLQAYETLARVLIWVAGVVALLSILGAFAFASSSSNLPLIGDIQRESRGITTIGTLAIGFTAAGLLAGVGAILRLMVLDRAERYGIDLGAADAVAEAEPGAEGEPDAGVTADPGYYEDETAEPFAEDDLAEPYPEEEPESSRRRR